jgi:hypothetical protein
MRRDRVAGIALAAAVMAGLVWASNAPMTAHRSSDAILRLAWSARPERILDCRQRSEEELARLPQHMRQPIACEGVTAEYRLQIFRDGALVVDRVVRGGGLRRDRRLYVLEEVPVPAADVSVIVRFDRVDRTGPVTGAPPRQPEAADPPQRGGMVPPQLKFERRLHFAPREVILVTYDPMQRELTTRQGSPAGR